MEDNEQIGALIYILTVFLSAMHVARDCKRIGEHPIWHVTGTIILWPAYYLIGWLWIWPGSLRRWIFGGSIEDLVQAKVHQRVAKIRSKPPAIG